MPSIFVYRFKEGMTAALLITKLKKQERVKRIGTKTRILREY